jgi:hypothetical protein
MARSNSTMATNLDSISQRLAFNHEWNRLVALSLLLRDPRSAPRVLLRSSRDTGWIVESVIRRLYCVIPNFKEV